MKLLTSTHPVEVAISKIEDILREHHLTIDHHYGTLRITQNRPGQPERQFDLIDADCGEGQASLPRLLDNERLKVVE